MHSELLHSFLEETLFVVVLYRAALSETQAYSSLSVGIAGREADLFAFDNSPDPESAPRSEGGWRMQYVSDPLNPGVSVAYNRACQAAREMGKTRIFLSDQDTSFAADALDRYASAVAQNPSVHLFAPILRVRDETVSPCRFRFGRGSLIQNLRPGLRNLEGMAVFNSGMLIDIATFRMVGGYDERFPLDYSDFAFLDRIRSTVNECCIVDTVCKHGQSDRCNDDRGEALERFGRYCRARRLYSTVARNGVAGPLVAMCKAIKLAFRFSDLSFLSVCLGTWVGKSHNVECGKAMK